VNEEDRELLMLLGGVGFHQRTLRTPLVIDGDLT
jgi:hypothetical protein